MHIQTSIQSSIAIEINCTRLDHRREEHRLPHATSADRRTAQLRDLRHGSQSIQTINMVLLQRSVGGKIDSVAGWHERSCPRLLTSREYDFDIAEIAGSANDSALIS